FVSFSETADGNPDVVSPLDGSNKPTGDLTNGGATPAGDILEYLTLHVRNDLSLVNSSTNITISNGNLVSGGVTQFNSYSSVDTIPAKVTISTAQPIAKLNVDTSQFNGSAAIAGRTY